MTTKRKLPVPGVRRSRARSPESRIAKLESDLRSCTAEVLDLRRVVTSLRAELDHLREKIRS